MLDLAKVDLEELVMALEDHTDNLSWWFNPATGKSLAFQSEELSDEMADGHPEDRGMVAVEAIPSHEGYGDMEDFIEHVRDPRARDLLERAIEGRGAFRRFKDTLFEFPELRDAWFRFHDARMARRALQWLADERLIDRDTADRAALEHPDPEVPGPRGVVDAIGIAEKAAAALRELYGDRLRKVILFGSWARGDAHPESDIDLLVVLDRVDSPWEELERMEPVTWPIAFEHDAVISKVAVSEHAFRRRSTPLLHRVAIEGREIG